VRDKKQELSPRRDMKLRRKQESSDELDELVKAGLIRHPSHFQHVQQVPGVLRPRACGTRQYIRARAPRSPTP
jgi:hypothetical protein